MVYINYDVGKEDLPMPWKEMCPVDQRAKFVKLWLTENYTKVELCKHFEISRPTGDFWIRRFLAEGEQGMANRSPAPRRHPNQTPAWQRDRIIAMRKIRPSMGPKKIVEMLKRAEPDIVWPAYSTADEILHRAGLVKPRKRRRRVPPDTVPFANCDRPNAVWSVDFKGQFRMRNGQWCYPLTVTDNYSRYLLLCEGMEGTKGVLVLPPLTRLFEEYGLPAALRTDNGAPFASNGLGGLSPFSVGLIKLGIRPERTDPGRPDQNGRHERMHRSLKAEALNPPQKNMAKQQRIFDDFVRHFNFERPHEALQNAVPADYYTPSAKPYPSKLEAIEYDGTFTVRRVRQNGEIRWKGQCVYASEVLAKEPIGLEAIGDGLWNIYFSFQRIGTLDERTMKISPCQGGRKQAYIATE